MPILTEEEAETLDDLLTNTVPEVNPNVEGPFIKNYRQGMMVALDQFSAQYLQSRMLATKQTELISSMIQKQMTFAE
jgi:hypothetical protein